MELLKSLFSQCWVGSLIAIIGLIIAFLLYRASQIKPRLVYQFRALRLISKEEKALPEEVDIIFKGRSVPRLTRTYIILWNSGKVMLDGKNIIVDDPLRLEFSIRAEVLRARVLKVTRKVNKFTIGINPGALNEVICSFDYLDPGDGAVIELLHNDEKRYPRAQGTIRGVPRGILDWGRILPSRSLIRPFSFENRRLMQFFSLFFGVTIFTIGFLNPIIFEALIPANSFSRWFFMISGLIYVFSSLYMLWITRRRFPMSLAIEDIEE